VLVVLLLLRLLLLLLRYCAPLRRADAGGMAAIDLDEHEREEGELEPARRSVLLVMLRGVHGRYYPPGFGHAAKIFLLRTVGVSEITLGSGRWADWGVRNARNIRRGKCAFVIARARTASP
jgi:hypothetical protein